MSTSNPSPRNVAFMLAHCGSRFLLHCRKGACRYECKTSTGRHPTCECAAYGNNLQQPKSPGCKPAGTDCRNLPNKPSPRSQQQQGTFVIFLVTLWLPITFLIIGTMHLKRNLALQVQHQKQLDNCVYSKLEKKCRHLNQISTLNKRLRNLEQIATGLRPALLVPFTHTAAKRAIEQLQLAAKLIVLAQQKTLAADAATPVTNILCQNNGLNTLPLTLTLLRKTSLTAPDFPGLLYWRPPLNEYTTAIQSTNRTGHSSSGYCEVQNAHAVLNFQQNTRLNTPLTELFRPNLRVMSTMHMAGQFLGITQDKSWLSWPSSVF